MKKLVFTFILLFISPISFAVCQETIINFQGKEAIFESSETLKKSKFREEIEICRYHIRYSRGDHLVYQLFDNYNRQVSPVRYCGITSRRPRDRALEHSRNTYKFYKPEFRKMIIVGNYSKKAALEQEGKCVCNYPPPDLNKKPKCKR